MKKYLLVVDMQNDFISGSLGSEQAEAIVDHAARKIESFVGDIIVTFDTHNEKYLDTAEGKKLPVKHCIENTQGWQLHPKIEASLIGRNFKPVQKAAFAATVLELMLPHMSHFEDFSVEIIGLCTDICVVSNALYLKACFPECPITVDSTCCAGTTPERHEAALETMRSCQIDVI